MHFFIKFIKFNTIINKLMSTANDKDKGKGKENENEE